MNILIIGGAGYLGGAVTDLLQQRDDLQVRVYDLLLFEDTYRKSIPFIRGDVRDRACLDPHLDWADVVVMLAGLVGDPACALNEALTREVNTDIVGDIRSRFSGKLIFMSSCSVYGAADGQLHEGSPLNPLSLYAKTKRWAEEKLEGTNTIIFRLGTLYGISDQFARVRFDLVVNTLTMRAAVHKRISVFGGQQFRPFLDVRDAAQAIVTNLDTPHTGIYNLHSENVTIFDVAQQIKAQFPDVDIRITDTKYQDERNYRVSSQKAVETFGFRPARTIAQGIAEMKGVIEDGRIKNSFLTRFSNYLYLRPLLTEYSSPLGRVITINS